VFPPVVAGVVSLHEFQPRGRCESRTPNLHSSNRGPRSRDVSFTLKTGMLELTAKFVPKEMIYKGQLAL
jgi:hypothetical protein